MAGLLYSDNPYGWLVFLVLTVIMGGAAAWSSGRAIAQTWRPFWQVPVYMIVLAFAVQFLHYALFAEPLLSLHFYGVSFCVLALFGAAGFRSTRAMQMAQQYSFAFEEDGLWGWKKKTG